MTVRKTLLGAAAAANALAAAAPSLDDVAFAPEDGITLTKTFETTSTIAVDDFSAIFGGQDVGGMLGVFQFSAESDQTIVVTDGYLRVEAGRPVELERTFDTIEARLALSSETGMGAESQDMSASSELEGAVVRFTLDEAGDGYDVEFANGDGDEALLEGLDEDMDLRFLLPKGSVSVDETWDVDVSELTRLVLPGGDLSFGTDDLVDEGPDWELETIIGASLEDKLDEAIQGSCTCTYTGIREEDGSSLAEIEIEIEIASALDFAEELEEVVRAIGEEVGEEIPLELDVADMVLDLEAEATLSWDLERGTVHSFRLSMDGEITLDFSFELDMDGETMPADVTLELSGSGRHTVGVEE